MSTVIIATPEYTGRGINMLYNRENINRLATDVQSFFRRPPIVISSSEEIATRLAGYLTDCWGGVGFEIDPILDTDGFNREKFDRLQKRHIDHDGIAVFLGTDPSISHIAHYVARGYGHLYSERLKSGTGLRFDTNGIVELPRPRYSMTDSSLEEMNAIV